MTATTVSTLRGLSPYSGAGPGAYRQLIHDVMAVEIPTTSIDEANDIVWLGWIPAGAVLVDYFVKVDDLDTGTSLAFVIGDTTTTNFFFTAAATTTAAQGGGVISPASTSTVKYTKYATATRIKWTTNTAAQTAAAGTVLFGLTYFIDPEFSVTTGPGIAG
jgi:hypothetical protein